MLKTDEMFKINVKYVISVNKLTYNCNVLLLLPQPEKYVLKTPPHRLTLNATHENIDPFRLITQKCATVQSPVWWHHHRMRYISIE